MGTAICRIFISIFVRHVPKLPHSIHHSREGKRQFQIIFPSENIFAGLKGGPAAAVQKTAPVQETVSAPIKPENEIKVTPRNDQNRTARAQIVLTPELLQHAVKVAQNTGVSFNELANQLLEQYCTSVEHNKG